MSERWMEFQGRPNRKERGLPRVTLNNQHVLLMNRAAYEAFGMPAAVTLFYDEGRRAIGLMPSDPSNTNSFPVTQHDKWSNRRVQLNPFCRNFGIDIRRTVQFNEIDIGQDGMMRLELNATVTIGRAERAVRGKRKLVNGKWITEN